MRRVPAIARARTIVGAAAGALFVVAGGFGAVAHADPPQHTTFTFSDVSTIPAGEFCDVAVRQEVVYSERATTFGDPDAPQRVIVRANALFTYTNLATGQTATDQGRFVFTVDDSKGTIVVRGLGVQLRDADGRLVEVAAGRTVLDSSTFEVIDFTPNTRLSGSYDEVVCHTLGAQPA